MLFLLSLIMWREDGLAIEEDFDFVVGATITRTEVSDFRATWESSLRRVCVRMDNGKWHLPILLAEKEKQKQRLVSKSEAGKAGAAKRWQTHNSATHSKIADPFSANGRPMADGMADDSFSSSTSTSSSTAITIKKTPTPLKPELEKIGSHFKATKEQIADLISADGEQQFKTRVQTINDYCAATGKTYKDYSAAYRNFRKRDLEQIRPSNGMPPKNESRYERSQRNAREFHEKLQREKAAGITQETNIFLLEE
jgi:hypothetical protein